MIDVSVLMPAIRTQNWMRMYQSLCKSCQGHSFELVLVSPFDLPPEFEGIKNVRLLKDFGHPTRAAQIGLLACQGRLIYHCVDDALFHPGAIDLAINLYDEYCHPKDVVNMRYTEGSQFSGQEWTHSFWFAHFHPELRLPGVNVSWKIAPHFLMSTQYLYDLGGWDCQFEYINHPLHDLMFRLQADGGRIFESSTNATSCDHHGGRTVDHAAIHDAQVINDLPIFEKMYSTPDAAKNRIHLDINNWKSTPDYWARRFKGTRPTTYQEILDLNETDVK